MNERFGNANLQLPCDLEGEKSILATVFYTPDVFDTVIDRLGLEDFFSNANREIFKVMLDLTRDGTVLSRQSVAHALEKAGLLEAVGGVAYLGDLRDYQSSAAALEYTLENVKNRALQRRLVELAQGIVHDGLSPRSSVEELLKDADRDLAGLLQEKYSRSSQKISDIITDVYEDIKQRMTSDETILGIQTGFVDLDEQLSGLRKANLIIVAARPSMGKTALALNMAANAALRYSANVVVFSLEMAKEELAFRLLASESRIDARRLRVGRITQGEMESFTEGIRRLSGSNIVVDDTPALGILELRARARRLHKEGLCDVIFVDYLQMLRGSGSAQSREQEIAEISRMLKAVAMELRIPVIALSQLNRGLENRENKRPRLSDLRESGAIEQDADVIVFIYRDDYYTETSEDKGIAELIVGKQRNGPVGSVMVAFLPQWTRFENLKPEADSVGF